MNVVYRKGAYEYIVTLVSGDEVTVYADSMDVSPGRMLRFFVRDRLEDEKALVVIFEAWRWAQAREVQIPPTPEGGASD